MMKTHLLFAPIAIFLFAGHLKAIDWEPVSQAELAQKTPRVDPAADAEAIFWDVKIQDQAEGGDVSVSLTHYIRIKIFTDRGKEKYSTVEIEQPKSYTIANVAGRTIKANGTIQELKKDAVFERDLAKTKGVNLKGKSFTLPNVETGDIIEYQYKETRHDEIASHMRLYFQREIPLWKVTYHLKPLSLPDFPYGMRSLAMQCKHPPFQKDKDYFFTTSMTDMPAFQEEPNMPPEDQLRAWVLIYYEEDKKIEPEKYWKQIGKEDYASFKNGMSVNNDVKRAAAEVVSGASDPMEKLALLDTFCRTKIENLNLTSARMTPEQRKGIKANNSPADTLKHKMAWGSDVDLLFAAMANAVGFDARMARIADRGDNFFSASIPVTYFIQSFSVGVKVNDKWVFFDPATPYMEREMLRWQEEGVKALVSDPKEGFFVNTQASEPDRSVRKRRATLKLADDGTLQGTLEYTYTGHAGVDQKRTYDDMTPAQREQDWKESMQDRLSTAEISHFEMTNADDLSKPLVVRHEVSVPGYAIRTGKRILLQPAFFERNASPRFTASQRKWPLYFHYPWAEDDEVTIDLPAGWELDQPVAPEGRDLGGVGAYSAQVLKTADGRRLVYRRKFAWGRGMNILFPPASYASVKKIFDYVQEQDGYTIALRAADAK
jgi:hypothetical protein